MNERQIIRRSYSTPNERTISLSNSITTESHALSHEISCANANAKFAHGQNRPLFGTCWKFSDGIQKLLRYLQNSPQKTHPRGPDFRSIVNRHVYNLSVLFSEYDTNYQSVSLILNSHKQRNGKCHFHNLHKKSPTAVETAQENLL